MVSISVIAGNLEEIETYFKTSIDHISFMCFLKSAFVKVLCPKL